MPELICAQALTQARSVFGVHELSQKIFEAREKKPIVAIANSEAYSAGYYLVSAAVDFELESRPRASL